MREFCGDDVESCQPFSSLLYGRSLKGRILLLFFRFSLAVCLFSSPLEYRKYNNVSDNFVSRHAITAVCPDSSIEVFFHFFSSERIRNHDEKNLEETSENTGDSKSCSYREGTAAIRGGSLRICSVTVVSGGATLVSLAIRFLFKPSVPDPPRGLGK